MYRHCLHWTQIVTTILLTFILVACTRSASTGTVMTPLPSAPPPTPTSIVASTLPATEPATATKASASTATTSPAKSTPVETATATKAIVGTETSCGNALPSRLHLDAYAYVNPDPPLPNNLRSEAGEGNDLLGMIQPGEAMKILEGPKCVEGSLWWKVSPLNSDLSGWTAEGDEQTYWLIPCASEAECGK